MSLSGFRSQLAVLNAGYEPIGVVMGAGAYQVYQPLGCYGGMGAASDFGAYEESLQLAWADVLLRLEDEARRVQAHGVIGVYPIEQRPGPGASMLELQLVGTAVRVAGESPLQRPFLSMLSMDDMLTLLLRGWTPSSIVFGISAVHVHGWNASPALQGAAFTNAEMDAPTAGIREARDRAERHAREMLRQSRAHGLIAATVEVDPVVQASNAEGLLIEGRILGTGVVRFGEAIAGVMGVRNLATGGSGRVDVT
jgi:uncharacterized protein YbjQ (UPF0145 family)